MIHVVPFLFDFCKLRLGAILNLAPFITALTWRYFAFSWRHGGGMEEMEKKLNLRV